MASFSAVFDNCGSKTGFRVEGQEEGDMVDDRPGQTEPARPPDQRPLLRAQSHPEVVAGDDGEDLAAAAAGPAGRERVEAPPSARSRAKTIKQPAAKSRRLGRSCPPGAKIGSAPAGNAPAGAAGRSRASPGDEKPAIRR